MLLKVMVNKVVIEFDEQNHVFGVGQVGSKVGIGMRCECLLECIKCNDMAGDIVQSIWCLAKIWAPS